MASVLLIDGFSEDAVFIGGQTPNDVCKMYLPYLVSLLRYNGIETDVLAHSGIEWNYKICGKTKNNLIYLPIISVADKVSDNVSFIYTDSTAADSVSFRIASNIRRNCEAEDSSRVIFINVLHEKDNFRRFSPIIVDNMRTPVDDEGFRSVYKTIFRRATVTARSICEHYNGAFKIPDYAE